MVMVQRGRAQTLEAGVSFAIHAGQRILRTATHQRKSSEKLVPPRSETVAMTTEREGAYAFVRLISARWTLKVLAELSAGGRRYQDVHNILGGVSHKVLTDTLRSAERDGLIVRRIDSERTDTTTLYELTDLGKSLDEPLATLGQWVDTHWHLVEGARRNWSARTEG
jgi:DNA-binding HxlR family transcriptional regulator